jgi:iron(III) transport system substrate-binding protein
VEYKLAAAGAQAQDSQVNIIGSVQAEWCNLIQAVYARTTGVKVDCPSRVPPRRWRRVTRSSS